MLGGTVMSIGTNVVAESRKMVLEERALDASENQSAIGGSHILASTLGQMEAKVEVLDRDKYSFLINQITISNKSRTLEKHTTQSLQRQAAAIAKNITYLLEDFALIEIDEKTGVAQVRSSPPHRKTAEIQYYEILLYGDRLVFNRYRKQKDGSARERVASHLSDEVLQRLIDDLAEVLNGEGVELIAN